MGLEKAISAGKEHRKPYCGTKAFDQTCRNHGACERCLRSRTYRTQKELEKCRFSRKDAEAAEPERGNDLWQIT